MSASDDQRLKSIDSIETYRYRIIKDLVCKKEENKDSSMINQYKND